MRRNINNSININSSSNINSRNLLMVITIDGPAGAGKSTIAKRLSQVLNIAYLDTGAMYRAVTLKALREKVNMEDERQLIELAKKTSVELKDGGSEVKIYLDGEDVSGAIRSQEVTNNTYFVARTPGVREVLVQWQRRIGKNQSVVVEGRDVGTVVFPDADKKFYLDADENERCQRRLLELQKKGEKVKAQQLLAEIKRRDHSDKTRAVGPLKMADDAILIDSTNLSIDEVVKKIINYINPAKVK